MKTIHLLPVSAPLHGELTVPGDKSISHRSIMFGSIAVGDTRITNFLNGADCLSTISCFRQMGIIIDTYADEIIVRGRGLHGLREPAGILDTGNSGTTMRLMSGILAGQPFASSITGDSSIRSRPMNRIIEPLRLMHADIRSSDAAGHAPLYIRPSSLTGIDYQSPIASAQVISCILLAGLYADRPVSVTEPALSRNHTELMLSAFGASVHAEGNRCEVLPGPQLHGCEVCVPGDISSAAYFVAAAAIVPGSQVLIRNVGINPTRDGILRTAKAMGADITLLDARCAAGESVADLLVRSGDLHGITIEGDIIPTLIDELPVIACMAAYAQGTTVIKDAAELKVKESDRIAVVTDNLRRMGCDIHPTDDGMIICGGKPLHGACIDSKKDHRIAMSFAVAALAAEGSTQITDGDCIAISYPSFYADLEKLQ